MSANNYQTKPNFYATEMPEDIYKDAIKLFNIPSTVYSETSISIYICNSLDKLKIPYSIDNYGNILVIKGDNKLYPCFCSHLDTVHIYKNGFKLLYNKEGNRTYLYACDNNKKSVGIGGDDKCGIFVCLYLLQRIDNIKVVFFSQEETGGIGSSNINLKFFDDCKFLASVDRWNGHDFINQYDSQFSISGSLKKAILPLLDKYDYSFNSGLFTDCFNVWTRGLKLSCFNLSCGYYSHHSDSEYIDTNELYNCCLLCEELSKLPDKYKCEYKRHKTTVKWDNSKYDWDYYKRDFYGYKTDILYCRYCGIELLPHEEEKEICDNCMEDMKQMGIKDDDDFLFNQ